MGERPHESGGRDWNYAVKNPSNIWSYQKLEEERGNSLLEPLNREHGPAHTLVSDFWPSELLEDPFLLF